MIDAVPSVGWRLAKQPCPLSISRRSPFNSISPDTVERTLWALGDDDRAKRLSQLHRHFEAPTSRVAIFGEFSRGKSTLINALLGRIVLPAMLVRTTGHAMRLVYGRTEEHRCLEERLRTIRCWRGWGWRPSSRPWSARRPAAHLRTGWPRLNPRMRRDAVICGEPAPGRGCGRRSVVRGMEQWVRWRGTSTGSRRSSDRCTTGPDWLCCERGFEEPVEPRRRSERRGKTNRQHRLCGRTTFARRLPNSYP
jgi:hypothetical protein